MRFPRALAPRRIFSFSLWTLGGRSWPALLKDIWRESLEDDLFLRAAGLAYYFLFSVFPLLLFLTSVFGHVMGARADLRQQLFEYVQAVIPRPETLSLVESTLEEIIARRGLEFSLGLAVAVIAASQGVVGVGRALDAAYDVEARRPFWRTQLVAIGLTLAFAVLSLAALSLLFWGGSMVQPLAGWLGHGSTLATLWRFLQWPLGLFFVVGAFELLYNFAPAEIDRRRMHFSSPGAVVGVALWLTASFVLRHYLARTQVTSWAYGSLGSLIALMIWFYLTGFSILVGGEINAGIQRALDRQRAQGVPAPAAARARRSAAARRERRHRKGNK